MKPCSAYCRPEEGVHVFVEWLYADEHAAAYVGLEHWRINTTLERTTCFPNGSLVRYVDIERAAESDDAPPSPDMPSGPWLITVQVVG